MNIKTIIGKAFVQLFLLSVAASCVFPLLWMISTSLKTRSEVYTNKSLIPEGINMQNYITAWKDAKFSVYFTNSILYTVCIVIGVLLVSSLAAYAYARLEFPLKKLTYCCFLITLMIPIPGSFIPLYVLLVKLGLQNTRIGYILPMINAGIAVGIFILRGFFEGIPKETEDAAIIDGCGKLGMYYKIVVPLSMPAMATIAIINTLASWNEYILAAVNFANNALMPVQQGLFVFQGQYFTQYELLMAANVITIIPMVLMYLLFNKQIIKGIAGGALKG